MADKLKPCKYCGGRAELVRVGDYKEYFAYRVHIVTNSTQDIVRQDGHRGEQKEFGTGEQKMSDKDRLIELLRKSGASFENALPEEIADYLLANGVIVPLFEIGTKVYVITSQTSNGKNLYIFEDIITAYQINMGYMVMCFDNHLGEPHWNWDKVFLTKEEAEEKLRELGK